MDRGKALKAFILTTIMVVLVVGYYFYLSSRNSKANSNESAEQEAEEMTVTQELLARSRYKEYPNTPVQVVKYYNEITSCFYNDNYSDEELVSLAELARSLCDDELNSSQSMDEFIEKLKQDIAVFSAGNITIYESVVTPSTDVVYFDYEGESCARLNSTYTLKSGVNYQTSKEVYILRKDQEGHWKILGFALDKES